jgi:hypothetical protein
MHGLHQSAAMAESPAIAPVFTLPYLMFLVDGKSVSCKHRLPLISHVQFMARAQRRLSASARSRS